MQKSNEQTVELQVYLPDEAVDVWRPTQAVVLGNGLYRLLPTPNYDPEDEIREFLPGTIVRAKKKELSGSWGIVRTHLVAVSAEE